MHVRVSAYMHIQYIRMCDCMHICGMVYTHILCTSKTFTFCRDGGPTGQVVGEDTVCVVLE